MKSEECQPHCEYQDSNGFIIPTDSGSEDDEHWISSLQFFLKNSFSFIQLSKTAKLNC